MEKRKDILKLEKRREIYNFITKYPGLHMREISRRMNIPLGSLKYHLNYLKKRDIILYINNQGYKRYYVRQNIGRKEKEILNILRQEIPKRIVLLLLIPGPGDRYKNKKTKQKAKEKPNPPCIYSKKELVDLTKYWHGPKGKLFHLPIHETTIDFHLQKLLDAEIIEKVRVGREIKYKLKYAIGTIEFLVTYNAELSDKAVDLWLSWLNFFKKSEYIDEMFNYVFEIFPHPYHA